MIVEVKDIGQIKITWSYCGNGREKIRDTTCKIIKPNPSKCKGTDEILCEGLSWLHPKDTIFIKDKGRKQSLKRALYLGNLSKDFITTKEQRKQIWDAYLSLKKRRNTQLIPRETLESAFIAGQSSLMNFATAGKLYSFEDWYELFTL
jgi:hypothetical protein